MYLNVFSQNLYYVLSLEDLDCLEPEEGVLDIYEDDEVRAFNNERGIFIEIYTSFFTLIHILHLMIIYLS